MDATRLLVPSNGTSSTSGQGTPPQSSLNMSLNGLGASMRGPDTRTVSARDFVSARRDPPTHLQQQRSPSFSARSSPMSLPSPSELFPHDPTLQELEAKDREWLQYRRAQRMKEELEDLHEYQVRLDARKKAWHIKQYPPDEVDVSAPLITDEDRKNFRILVGIDKKKAKEHAAGLVFATYQNSHVENPIHLFNCFTKKSAKRKEETLAHLEQIKKQLLEFREEANITTASSHVAKDKGCAIIEYSEEHKIDLLVLGMKQGEKTFFARKVSPGVIDSLPDGKAVLLVPPPDESIMNIAEKDAPRNILFCYDGTPHCEDALRYLAHVLREQDCLTVCNVVTPPPKLVVVARSDDSASLQPNANYETILSQRVATTEQLLAKVNQRLLSTINIPEENIKSELRVLEPGKNTIGDIILEIAKQLNSSLVILGARGVDGWQKVMQGAVTQSVLETATRRAIMIVR